MTNRTELQIKFEAECFMHEISDANELRYACQHWNDGRKISNYEKALIVKAIWRL